MEEVTTKTPQAGGTLDDAVRANLQPQKAATYTLNIGDIIRVADKYYQVILDADGRRGLLYRDKNELKADGVVLQSVRKFNGFTNDPNFLNYKADVNGFYNLASPLEWTPHEGGYPTIRALLTHVAGEKYEILLDYYTLLIRKPKQALPIVVLVSSEQGTGKSTVLTFNEILFGNNAVILKVSEYCQQFNGLYASKLIICIDESAIREDFIKERLKMDSTAKFIQLRKMHQEHTRIAFFGKFFLATNRELDFAKIDSDDIRFFVLKVPQLKSFDADFLSKLKDEAPCFLNFLLNRELSTSKALSRQWFSREQLETDALRQVRENSISDCAKDLRVFLDDALAENPLLKVSTTDLAERLGKRYTLSQIRKAMTQELGIEMSSPQYYTNQWGDRKSGRVYDLSSYATSKETKESAECDF